MLDLTQNRFLRCRLSYFAFPTFLTFLPTIHFCNSVFLAFTQFLMEIYHFLIELHVNNFPNILTHDLFLQFNSFSIYTIFDGNLSFPDRITSK